MKTKTTTKPLATEKNPNGTAGTRNGVALKQSTTSATTSRSSAGSDFSQKASSKRAAGKANARAITTATMTTEELTLRSFKLARENSQSRKDG